MRRTGVTPLTAGSSKKDVRKWDTENWDKFPEKRPIGSNANRWDIRLRSPIDSYSVTHFFLKITLFFSKKMISLRIFLLALKPICE